MTTPRKRWAIVAPTTDGMLSVINGWVFDSINDAATVLDGAITNNPPAVVAEQAIDQWMIAWIDCWPNTGDPIRPTFNPAEEAPHV